MSPQVLQSPGSRFHWLAYALCVPLLLGSVAGCGDNSTGDSGDGGAPPDGQAEDGSTSCGDGVLDPGETCDEGGETATCDADCTVPQCGDGVVNEAAGEACDGGPTCGPSCQPVAVLPASGLMGDQTLVIPETAELADTVGFAKVHPTVTLPGPTYEILSGNTGDVFAMDPGTGEITIQTAGLLDAGTTPSYALQVRVSDALVGTDTATITVEVLADSAVVYIDPDNSADPSADGSREHPFASFNDFSFAEGTAYLFRRGTTLTHDDGVVIGQSDLLLGAYGSGARPVYHCTASQSGGNVHALYNWSGPQNVTVRDLEIYAPDATSCIRFGGDGGSQATVDNCSAHGAIWGIRAFSLTGLKIVYSEVHDIGDDGMFIQNVTDIEVAYNDVHDVNTHWQFPYTPQTEAAGDAVQFSDCNAWHVHHNRLDRTNSGNKFCFISNNATQSSGILEYNHLRGPLTDGDGGASIYFGSGSDLIVRYNIIQGPSPTALYHHTDNLRFYGNVVWGMSGGVQCHVPSACTVDNNVFHEVDTHILASGDLVARNNIFSLQDGSQEAIVCSGGLTESHNLYTMGTGGTSSVIGDPLFVDAAGGNFRLQPGSGAIDSGTDVSLPFDLDGNPIPTGSAPDIGAYEYQPQ